MGLLSFTRQLSRSSLTFKQLNAKHITKLTREIKLIKAPGKSAGNGPSRPKKPFNKMRLLNWIGLPAIGYVLLHMLPTQKTDDIHSIDYYSRHPDYWKERAEQMDKTHSIHDDPSLDPKDQGHFHAELRK